MLKYQAGDNMAFDVLYSRHKDKVYSYLSKRLRDQDQCEDLFQKVFTKFHRSKKLYNSNTYFDELNFEAKNILENIQGHQFYKKNPNKKLHQFSPDLKCISNFKCIK